MLRPLLCLAALLLVAAPSPAEEGKRPQSSETKEGSEASKHQPYLTDAVAPNGLAILPPPPGSHSVGEKADQAVFAATRALDGSDRWQLATNDVADGIPALIEDFACALGQKLDPARTPALMVLLDRSRLDFVRSVRNVKRHYRRLRPFIGNEQAICVARDPALAESFSYPSGHATIGWGYAMILASLMPEKATQFMVRGRLYGDSRIVCGVHWMSDVVAARSNAAAVVAALQGDASFRADWERARQELPKALAAGGAKPDETICAREEAAARESPF